MTTPALATAAVWLAMPGSNRRTSAARVRAYVIAPPDRNAARAAADQAGYRGALIKKNSP
jgi:hypothetical protein